MKITIQLGSWAKSYVSAEVLEQDMPKGASVADLLTVLPIPEEEIGLISINGQAVLREKKLENGEILKIFPAVMGG